MIVPIEEYMARSFHATKRTAIRAYKDGDLAPVKELALKRDVKRETKWVTKFYKSSKSHSTSKQIKNSTLISMIKRIDRKSVV